jgi:predicted TIM-barrel fold metal-dependent hydrolase
VVGVRLPFISMAQVPDVTTPEYRRFLKRLVDLDWHVHLHIEGEKLPQTLPGLEASGVKIVIDHLGRPDPKTGIASEGFRAMLASIEKGRTWVKLSGGYRLGAGAADYARELVRRAPAERLVWASDCPFVGEEKHISYQGTLDWLRQALPDPSAQRKVLSQNAIALYGFDDAA